MRPVKSPSGSLRAEQAAVTRRRIADAARTLFGIRGYGATTLREVAGSAGVAVQTVYAVFGSKANILRELRERLAAEPDADAAFGAALAEPDSGRALDHFARSIRTRWEVGHDIVTIHIEAASVDSSIRAELETVLSRRRTGIESLARSLVPGEPALLDAAHIGAILDALSLPEVYADLVGVHGWSADAYEAWLAASFRRMILG